MHTEGIFRLAQERARTSFAFLLDNMLLDADALLVKASAAASGNDARPLAVARALLRDHGPEFKSRLRAVYDGYLERAMQTMHFDTRRDMPAISADSLSLIEDDVVIRQIEVDRILVRLRDADQLNLGRLNLTIAHLHGDNEVRERENPFRPYLLARALHEAVNALSEESVPAPLFDVLPHAMVPHLPRFYADILDVFESRAELPKLHARPAAGTRADAHWAARKRVSDQLLDRVDNGGSAVDAVRALNALTSGLAQQGGAGGGAGKAAAPAGPADLQGLLANVFNFSKAARGATGGETQGLPRNYLDSQLLRLQQEMAAGAPLSPQLLHERMTELAGNMAERPLVELIGLMFDFIAADELMQAPVRRQLQRLRVPFTRAAVLEPALLQDGRHPARNLLDRVGSAGAGVPATVPGYAALERKTESLLDGVVARFMDNVSVFAEAERGFDTFLAALLRNSSPAVSACADAIAEAEIESALVEASRTAMTHLIDPLKLDVRSYVFFTGPWARVLALSPRRERYVQLVPDLLWSVQPRTAVRERGLLVPRLGELVRMVREGLASIAMAEEDATGAFEQLAAVHMDVLANKMPRMLEHMTLDEMRIHCIGFAIPVVKDARLETPDAVRLDAALRRRQLAVELHAAPAGPGAGRVDWLERLRPGTGFDLMVDGKPQRAWVCVISAGRGAVVLAVEGRAEPLLYGKDALHHAVREGVLRAREYAPLFDRAVESLMAGAPSVRPA